MGNPCSQSFAGEKDTFSRQASRPDFCSAKLLDRNVCTCPVPTNFESKMLFPLLFCRKYFETTASDAIFKMSVHQNRVRGDREPFFASVPAMPKNQRLKNLDLFDRDYT
jgi:hypothetical protein